MSVLIQNARRYAAQAGTFTPDDKQLGPYRAGREFAGEVIEDLRKQDVHPRLLLIACGMAAMARDDAFAAGFHAALHAEIREVVRGRKA